MNYPSSPLIDKHFDVAALRLFMNTCSKYIDDRIQNVITRHKTKKNVEMKALNILPTHYTVSISM